MPLEIQMTSWPAVASIGQRKVPIWPVPPITVIRILSFIFRLTQRLYSIRVLYVYGIEESRSDNLCYSVSRSCDYLET